MRSPALGTESTRNDKGLAPCGGCRMSVGAVHRYPGCTALINGFYGDGDGNKEFVQKKKKFKQCV